MSDRRGRGLYAVVVPRRFVQWLSALSAEAALPAIRRWDVVLSVVLLALTALELVIGDLAWPVALAGLGIVGLVAVPFRRRYPLEAFATPFVVAAVFESAGSLADIEFLTTFGLDLVGVVLLYALCRWASIRRVGIGVALGSVLLVGAEFITGSSVGSAFAILVPWGVVVGFSLAMRYRARLRESELAQVRLAERNVLARELHDSVAHHVSAIAVQAQAARYVAKDNPAAAVDAIEAIEATANEAIDEMRRMVGVLRSADDEQRTVTPVSLASLADPRGNPKITLVGATDLADLSSPVAAAVFRIAQESITNARRHSDGVSFVDVDLAERGDDIELEVINDGSPTTRNTGSGFGLVGMEERVAALHGTIEAGPRPTNGWRVAVTIPKGARQ